MPAVESRGSVEIRPPLNDDEQAYLTAFCSSRRHRRPRGPYAVPGNPAAEGLQRRSGGDPAVEIADGQPSLWCPWVVCWDGCCLTLEPTASVARAGDWLRYLIDSFLRPGAVVAASGLPQFVAFTFDHRLDGLVVAPLTGGADVLMLLVVNNAVYDEVTSAADPRLGGHDEEQD